jgi:hypothetical protein
MKAGVLAPTPDNLQRVADEAAAKRASEAEVQNSSASSLGRAWGISRDFVLDYQRLTARVAELERELAALRSTSTLPAHMRDVERRG